MGTLVFIRNDVYEIVALVIYRGKMSVVRDPLKSFTQALFFKSSVISKKSFICFLLFHGDIGLLKYIND